MCHVCVMQSVKQKMLDRRGFLKASVALSTATAAATVVNSTPALADGHKHVADMTHTLSEEFPTFFGEPGISIKQQFNFAENGFNLNDLMLNEHTGTHMDAPLHFTADGHSVAEIPVENLIVPLAVIDIKEKASENPDAQLTPEDLKAWISKHGPLPDNCCVAMNSGWDKHVKTDKFRNADADSKMHFPGFHVDAVTMLMEEADVAGIAVDTLSLDHGPSADFATHYAWLPSNRWGIECLANLDAVPATGATLVVGAPKVSGGTGGPSRIFTLI